MDCKELFNKFVESSELNIFFHVKKLKFDSNFISHEIFKIWNNDYEINNKNIPCNLEKLIDIRKLAKKKNIKNYKNTYTIVNNGEVLTMSDDIFSK